jgi:hypothetical protein
VGLLLLGLCAITAYAVLRASGRQRVAAWPVRWIVGLGVVAVVPWLVVWLAPIQIEVSIKGLGPLLGWFLLALGAFALLVLLPLVSLVSAGVWTVARRRTRKGVG